MADRLVHIGDEGGLAVLWGGPVFANADNIDPQDQALLDEYSVVLNQLWERDGDDGKFWRRKLVLVGVEITKVLLKDGQPHVQLPYGSWLVLDTDGDDLADQAIIYSIYQVYDLRAVDVPPGEPRLTWLALREPGFSVTGEDTDAGADS